MILSPEGIGKFKEVILKPQVVINDGDGTKAEALHHDEHRACFIANSVNFSVKCGATISQLT